MGAPSQAPSVEVMLRDQANRWNQSNARPTGIWSNLYGGMPQPTAEEDQFDWESLLGGNDNMFFTGQGNEPSAVKMGGSTRNPFTWSGGNDSLRDAYKATYDAYYKGSPASTSFYDTWQGPEIRAVMGEEGEAPTYWQDNNADKAFSSGIDAAYAPKGSQGLSGMFANKQPAQPEEDLEDLYM